MDNFNSLLKSEMKKKKITQKVGAKKLGISRSWFNRKINGKVGEFSMIEISILCKAFKIDMNKLLKNLDPIVY